LTEGSSYANIITSIVQKMTTILKPWIYKILKAFYQSRKKIHVRELSRETGLYGQSIFRYLKELEEKKILKAEREGNLKQYSLVENQEVYGILAMFDIEKTRKLPLLRGQAISTYLHSLPKPPVFCVVFGSTAKGNYKEGSDIDILIVTLSKIETKHAEKEADALCGMRISTFQIGFKEFIKELRLKDDKVVQSAIFTGHPVINHVYYYEVLHNERA